MSNCFYVSKNDGSVGTNTAYADLYDAIVDFQAELMDMSYTELNRWLNNGTGWFGICTIDAEGGHDFIAEAEFDENVNNNIHVPDHRRSVYEQALGQGFMTYEDYEYYDAMAELDRMSRRDGTIATMLQCVAGRNNKFTEMWENILVLARVFPEMPISEAVRQVEKRRDA